MIFLDACFKRKTEYAPIWLMRQAGRYLPEYRATRAKAKDFVDFCRRPELACEATLQPIDILGVDAAILFSDILVIPLEMGLGLEFIEKKGPVFKDTIQNAADLSRLADDSVDKLTYVYDAVKMIRASLPKDKALIGFAGSPWTLATYMIEGGTSKQFEKAKKMIYADPVTMRALLQKLTDAVAEYLCRQIEAGANAVQVFDSWGGALEKSVFFEFSWKYMQEIASKVKAKHPNTPVILFSKGIGCYLDGIDGNFDVFGVDWSTPMQIAKNALGDKYAIQGNLEPARLYSKDAILEGVSELANIFKGHNGWIFNLGHGMQPDMNPDNVKYLIEVVREKTAN